MTEPTLAPMVFSDQSLIDSRILIIDDHAENVLLVERTLKWAGFHNLLTVCDSRQALPSIEEFRPDLILLDLDMPHMDGYQVLTHLRKSEDESSYLPVLIFTAMAADSAKHRALSLGASDFLTKPGDVQEILLRVRNFLRARKMHLALQAQNVSLDAKVRARTAELEDARLEILGHLARAGEFHDDETGDRTKRVCEMSSLIAKELGLPAEESELIGFAAQLHDVGKIGIPDRVLLKPGRLTADELEVMRLHTEIGGHILQKSKAPLLKLACEIALYHHENWDGTGYLMGLKGEDIPICARIVAVAEVYDALISERPYRDAWTEEKAFEEIGSLSGSKFDPAVVDAFFKCVSERAQLQQAA